jgi:UDP-N-acetylmuramoyl-tripeptide--D-alanyl-D-alanine ligase
MLTLGHILETLSDYRATGNEPAVSSFVVDSREAGPGSVFVAFVGERADGHAFIADAFARGAIAALVERAPVGDWSVFDATRHRAGRRPPRAGRRTQQAVAHPGRRHPARPWQALARAWRARSNVRVIGITGSVGKTSTVETPPRPSRRYNAEVEWQPE